MAEILLIEFWVGSFCSLPKYAIKSEPVRPDGIRQYSALFNGVEILLRKVSHGFRYILTLR